MDKDIRAGYYALASSLLSHEIDEFTLNNLKKDTNLLEVIGKETKEWLLGTPNSEILDGLNTDFSSLFLLYDPPIEAAIRDNSKEIPTGPENPVFQFYRKHNYHLNLNLTHLNSPDHLSIELGFMQKLAEEENDEASKAFLADHLLSWAPSYLLAQSSASITPFYRDFCHFVAEFLVADYDQLVEKQC